MSNSAGLAAINQWVDANSARLLEELFQLIRIPSISTLPEHAGDVARAAQFTADALKTAGLENIEIIPTERHPLIYADWLHAPGKPTVLCYGHYDVQPPDPLELWVSPPFEPEVRNGNIYARGAVDDKGQMYAHIKALEAVKALTGTFPLNIKVLIEGDEEIGGAPLARPPLRPLRRRRAQRRLRPHRTARQSQERRRRHPDPRLLRRRRRARLRRTRLLEQPALQRR